MPSRDELLVVRLVRCHGPDKLGRSGSSSLRVKADKAGLVPALLTPSLECRSPRLIGESDVNRHIFDRAKSPWCPARGLYNLVCCRKRPLLIVHAKTRLIRNVIRTVSSIQIGIMAKTPCFDSPPSMHTKRRVMCSNLSVIARLCSIQPKEKSRQKGSGLLANIFGTSEGSDWHGLDCSNWLEVLFRQTCSRLLQNHFLGLFIISPTQERRLPQLVMGG